MTGTANELCGGYYCNLTDYDMRHGGARFSEKYASDSGSSDSNTELRGLSPEEQHSRYVSILGEKEGILFMYADNAPLAYLRRIKGEFSGAYQKLSSLEKLNNIPQNSELVRSTIKPFWDKYCEIEKANLD